MKKIKLTKGKYTIVDNEDFEYLNQWKWFFKDTGYAVRSEYMKLGINRYKRWRVYMHRVINNTPDNLQTDHINHNGLDNRKTNLRTVTNQQNAFNAGLSSANTSGAKGVSWSKTRKKWCAYIHINSKAIPLGRFFNIKDAISARKKAELKYHLI